MEVKLWKLKEEFVDSAIVVFPKKEDKIRPIYITDTGSKVIKIFFKNKWLEKIAINKRPNANIILAMWALDSDAIFPKLIWLAKEAKITKEEANISLVLSNKFKDIIFSKYLDIPKNVKSKYFLFL